MKKNYEEEPWEARRIHARIKTNRTKSTDESPVFLLSQEQQREEESIIFFAPQASLLFKACLSSFQVRQPKKKKNSLHKKVSAMKTREDSLLSSISFTRISLRVDCNELLLNTLLVVCVLNSQDAVKLQEKLQEKKEKG